MGELTINSIYCSHVEYPAPNLTRKRQKTQVAPVGNHLYNILIDFLIGKSDFRMNVYARLVVYHAGNLFIIRTLLQVIFCIFYKLI